MPWGLSFFRARPGLGSVLSSPLRSGTFRLSCSCACPHLHPLLCHWACRSLAPSFWGFLVALSMLLFHSECFSAGQAGLVSCHTTGEAVACGPGAVARHRQLPYFPLWPEISSEHLFPEHPWRARQLLLSACTLPAGVSCPPGCLQQVAHLAVSSR